MYSLENDDWIEIAPMKKQRDGASACLFNNQFIYIIGGGSNDEYEHLNDIEKYDITENSMETIEIVSEQQLPEKTLCLSFCIDSSSILIVDGDGYVDRWDEDWGCYMFDPSQNTVRKTNDFSDEDSFTNPYTLRFGN